MLAQGTSRTCGAIAKPREPAALGLAESSAHLEARFGAGFGSGPTRADELADVLDHLLAMHCSRTTSVLFFELWALASHDRGVRGVMVRFYRAYAERVAGMLPDPPPSAAARSARAKAVVAMLEGMAVFSAGLAGAMTAEDWRLALEHNGIGGAGESERASSEVLANLEHLRLTGNRLGDRTRRILRARLAGFGSRDVTRLAAGDRQRIGSGAATVVWIGRLLPRTCLARRIRWSFGG